MPLLFGNGNFLLFGIRSMDEKFKIYFRQLKEQSSEHEQALFRIIFVVAASILYYVAFLGTESVFPFAAFAVMGIAFAGALTMFLWELWSKRVSSLRQFVFLPFDIGAISYAMYAMHEFGIALFFLYLWIITGCGMVLGTRGLIKAYLFCLVGFSLVIHYSQYWQSQPFLALGMMLTLALVPIYILRLLNRLTLALNTSTAAMKDATEATKAKSQFLANMSHEIRTPLNGFVGACELLTITPLNQEQHELVTSMNDSSKLLSQLIEGVLDLSRIESGYIVSEKSDFDLHDLVSNAVEMFIPAADKQGLKLSAQFTPDTHFALHGDALHLLQILINLVGNAIKFTEKGGVDVRVSTINQDTLKTCLRIEIVDTGIGISPTLQKVIFDRFVQANAFMAKKYGGTGLGLSISQYLVELLGGKMGLESILGIGSVFWFELQFDKQASQFTDPEVTSLDQLHVLGIGITNIEAQTLISHLSSWGVAFEHLHSLPLFFSRLLFLRDAQQKGVVLLCDPRSFGMSPLAMASLIYGAEPRRESIILLNPDMLAHTSGEYLSMGYCCLLKSPIEKPLLFNALHTILGHPHPSGVRSFREHFEQTNKNRQGSRILVAEDNSTNRLIISKILEYNGHKVELAVDGVQALDKLERGHFDLMLFDMNMPRMGGIEALNIYRAAHREGSRIPVIILTAVATIEAMQECGEADVDAFLTKPVDAITLLDTIDRLTEIKESVQPEEQTPAPSEPLRSQFLSVSALHQLSLMDNEDGTFQKAVIENFLADTEAQLKDMKDAVEQCNFTAFKAVAHTIKGGAADIGAVDLHQLCGCIMRTEQAELSDKAHDLFDQVRDSFDSTGALLKTHLNGATGQ